VSSNRVSLGEPAVTDRRDGLPPPPLCFNRARSFDADGVTARLSIVQMAKLFDFQWQISVPDSLLRGGRFDRWEEVGSFFVLIVLNVFIPNIVVKYNINSNGKKTK